MDFLSEELSEGQKKKVEMLLDKYLSMNMFEMRYFAGLQSQKI